MLRRFFDKIYWIFRPVIYLLIMSCFVLGPVGIFFVIFSHSSQNLEGILLSVFCASVSLAITVVFIFSFLLPDDFIKKHKSIEKFLNCFLYATLALPEVLLILFGMAIVFLIYFENIPWISVLFLSLLILSLLLYIFIKSAVEYLSGYWLICYRIMFVSTVVSTSLLFIALSLYAHFFYEMSIYSNYTKYSLASCFITAAIVYLAVLHYHSYINFRRQRFMLLLRNFTMDKQISHSALTNNLYHICAGYRIFLMRIGNPAVMFDSYLGKTLYLNTLDWQDRLKKHIAEAHSVFVVISHSDGLFWEIFNHLQYSHKFIYHIIDIVKMREDLAKNLYEKADNTQFIGFLNFIVHEFKGPFIVSSGNDDSAFWSISFTFNDTSLVVSSHLETIVDYLFNRRSIDHASVNAQYLVEIPLEKNGEFTYIVYEGAKYLLKHDRFELNNCSL